MIALIGFIVCFGYLVMLIGPENVIMGLIGLGVFGIFCALIDREEEKD